VRANGPGTVFIAAAGALSARRFLFGRVDGTHVRFQNVPSPAIGFLDLVVEGESIWVAVSGVGPQTSAQRYRPFLILSEDGGDDWSSPAAAPSFSGGNTQRIRIASAGPERVGVVWSEDPNGGTRDSVIRYSLTGDRGLSWSEPVEHHLPEGNVNRLTAGVGPCGWVMTFHTVGLDGQVGKVEWTPAGPRPTEDLFPDDHTLDLEVVHAPWSGALELVHVYRPRVEASDTVLYRMAVIQLSSGRPSWTGGAASCRKCCDPPGEAPG
jgi:hypothetical protein